MTIRKQNRKQAFLVLEDGARFSGFAFGATKKVSGEVVFNTGMVGYPESFTDPSYCSQILALTYPLIGNYGVPTTTAEAIRSSFESERVQISGLVVSEYSEFHSHWEAERGLSDWLVEQGIPGIAGVDTRALTKKLRVHGTMLGMITSDASASLEPGSSLPPVPLVSVSKPVTYGSGKKRVALIDCGCKQTIITSLVTRGVSVIRVPWNYDVTTLDLDGVVISNGPGDPTENRDTIDVIKKIIAANIPTFGICLGNQLLALAAGAKTFKLKYGHRSQNQPCKMLGTKRCYITSQNHGYAVDTTSLPAGWEPWFENTNDGTNEGIRHRTKPMMSVQFHPEAMPGPVDTAFLFDEFRGML